jgi:hypothetical protein
MTDEIKSTTPAAGGQGFRPRRPQESGAGMIRPITSSAHQITDTRRLSMTRAQGMIDGVPFDFSQDSDGECEIALDPARSPSDNIGEGPFVMIFRCQGKNIDVPGECIFYTQACAMGRFISRADYEDSRHAERFDGLVMEIMRRFFVPVFVADPEESEDLHDLD